MNGRTIQASMVGALRFERSAATVPRLICAGIVHFTRADVAAARNRSQSRVIVHDWQIRHWTHGWKSDDDRPT
jgi:hypothetical protein